MNEPGWDKRYVDHFKLLHPSTMPCYFVVNAGEGGKCANVVIFTSLFKGCLVAGRAMVHESNVAYIYIRGECVQQG